MEQHNGVPQHDCRAQRSVSQVCADLLQRDISVDPEWLVEFEETKEARHLKRIIADAELLLALQLAGFEGAQWEAFADALAGYGFQVMRAWIRSGKVFIRCREKKIRGSPSPPDRLPNREDAEDLAIETVGIAIRKYRDTVLVANRWSPRGGASLKTFFIGQCLIRFPNVYDRWERQQRHWSHQPLHDCDEASRWQDSDAYNDPERTVITALELDQALSRLDQRTTEVLQLTALGFSQSEISRLLACTEKAIELVIYRHRRRWARQRKDHTA
jgi:DNA-directed RNA polymerase specialized sigma24 family protein